MKIHLLLDSTCRSTSSTPHPLPLRQDSSTPEWSLELPAPHQTHFIWLTEHAWATNGMSDCLLSWTHWTEAASLRCKHGDMIGGTTGLASPERVRVRHFFLQKRKANKAAEYIHLFSSFKHVSIAKIAHIFEKNQQTITMLLISALMI